MRSAEPSGLSAEIAEPCGVLFPFLAGQEFATQLWRQHGSRQRSRARSKENPHGRRVVWRQVQSQPPSMSKFGHVPTSQQHVSDYLTLRMEPSFKSKLPFGRRWITSSGKSASRSLTGSPYLSFLTHPPE
jgi:hypothetical protein